MYDLRNGSDKQRILWLKTAVGSQKLRSVFLTCFEYSVVLLIKWQFIRLRFKISFLNLKI